MVFVFVAVHMEFYTLRQACLPHSCVEPRDMNGATLNEMCAYEVTEKLKGKLHAVTKKIFIRDLRILVFTSRMFLNDT
jgi:hypothetical protein